MGNFTKVRDADGRVLRLATADLEGALGATTAELIRDTIGTALVAGTNITITPDDGADTITIASAPAYTAENARDDVGAALLAGQDITITVIDVADTIAIAYVGDGYTSASVTGNTTVNYTTARVHKLTMTGNITLTLTGPTNSIACGVTLYLVQDGTGSRLVTWPASVKWPGGVAPTLSTAAGSVDVVVLESFDGGTTWYGNLAGKAYA